MAICNIINESVDLETAFFHGFNDVAVALQAVNLCDSIQLDETALLLDGVADIVKFSTMVGTDVTNIPVEPKFSVSFLLWS